MSRKYQLFSSFFIYASLLMLLNHFIGYPLEGLAFLGLAILSYSAIFLLVMWRKWVARTLVALLILLLLLYGADALLKSVFGDELVFDGNRISRPEVSTDVDVNSEGLRLEEGHTAGAIFYIRIHQLKQQLDFERAAPFFKWLFSRANQDDKTENPLYESIYFLGAATLLSLLVMLITHYKYSKYLLLAPIVAFVFMWYGYVDLPRKIYAAYFISVFAFFVLDGQAKLKSKAPLYSHAHYDSGRLFQYALALGMGVIALATVLTVIFPLEGFNRIADPLMPNLWGGRSSYGGGSVKMYSLNDTPFQSNENALGGPIMGIDRETVLFKIKVEDGIKSPLYLKGNVKDYYDGYRWLSHANTYKNQFEFYSGSEENQGLVKSDAVQKIRGTIELESLKTITLFAPMGLYDTSLGNKVYVSVDNEAFYKSGAFISYLKSYDFSATGKDYSLSDEVDYLQLPSNMDQGLLQLSKNLGNYGYTDSEKMVIMTTFLLKNYRYTLYPPPYSKDREFVSKFIFETREGYCTYFASALTVMARINEIPARYVEGFRVDPGNEDEDGFANVTEGEAHAWCEVYLEGKGWVIFESTPAYVENDLTIDKRTTEALETVSEESSSILPVLDEEVSDFKESMLEENMIIGDDGGGSGYVYSEVADKTQTRFWIYLGSVLFLFAIGTAFIYNRSLIRPNGTRKRLLRMLHYVFYLLKRMNPTCDPIPDLLLTHTSATISEQELILAYLYSQRNVYSSEETQALSKLTGKLIFEQEKALSSTVGFLTSWLLRGFGIHKVLG